MSTSMKIAALVLGERALCWAVQQLGGLEMRISLVLTIAVVTLAYGPAEAFPKNCGSGLMRCSTGCIDGPDKAENACLRKCTKKYDGCVAAGGVRGSSTVERGPAADSKPPKPRGKPGEAYIPPVGGSILDSGPGLGTQGPAGTGAPLGGGKTAPPPAKIY